MGRRLGEEFHRRLAKLAILILLTKTNLFVVRNDVSKIVCLQGSWAASKNVENLTKMVKRTRFLIVF